jgi:hypothetical protein
MEFIVFINIFLVTNVAFFGNKFGCNYGTAVFFFDNMYFWPTPFLYSVKYNCFWGLHVL